MTSVDSLTADLDIADVADGFTAIQSAAETAKSLSVLRTAAVSAVSADPEDHGLTVTVQLVTPEQAAAWLGNNGKHRPIKRKDVDKYAKRMTAGTWMLNGKTIVLDRNGRLIGGQHRLSACVQSGASFLTLVVHGVDPDVLTQESE